MGRAPNSKSEPKPNSKSESKDTGKPSAKPSAKGKSKRNRAAGAPPPVKTPDSPQPPHEPPLEGDFDSPTSLVETTRQAAGHGPPPNPPYSPSGPSPPPPPPSWSDLVGQDHGPARASDHPDVPHHPPDPSQSSNQSQHPNPDSDPPKRKRGRPRKVRPEEVPKPEAPPVDLPPYAYRPVGDVIPDFEYAEIECSSAKKEQSERVTSYEPSMANVDHMPLPLVLTKVCDNDCPVPWPTASRLHCLHCDRPVPGVPWMIPIARKRNHYVMDDGHFCRFECAAAEVVRRRDFHATTQMAFLVDIAVRIFKMDRKKLRPAGPRKMLDKYSASGVSLEEFHSGMMHPEVRVHERLPPFIPVTVMFEKTHKNEARWQVRGLRLPSKEEVDRIYREDRVVGPKPYPGQAAMYESFLQNYDVHAKDWLTLEPVKKRVVKEKVVKEEGLSTDALAGARTGKRKRAKPRLGASAGAGAGAATGGPGDGPGQGVGATGTNGKN